MSIIINIDVMLAKRKMSVTELSERVGITMANISVLKNGKAKAVKISTLNSICKALDCQPGDILEYVEDGDDENDENERSYSDHVSSLPGAWLWVYLSVVFLDTGMGTDFIYGCLCNRSVGVLLWKRQKTGP